MWWYGLALKLLLIIPEALHQKAEGVKPDRQQQQSTTEQELKKEPINWILIDGKRLQF